MSGAIAIGAAVVGTALAIDAVATVGITVTTALAVVGAAGAVTAAVGAITGNKTLSLIGGIVGAVGAVGAIANSAGLFSGAVAGEFSGIGGDSAGFMGGGGSGGFMGSAAGGEFMGGAAGAGNLTIESLADVGQNAAGIGGVGADISGDMGGTSFAGTDIPNVGETGGTGGLFDVSETGGPPSIDTTVKVPETVSPTADMTQAVPPPDVAPPNVDVASAPMTPQTPEAPGLMQATAGVDPTDQSKLASLLRGDASVAPPSDVTGQPQETTIPTLGGSGPGMNMATAGGDKSWFSSIMDFMKSKDGLMLGMAGAKFFAGAFGPESQLVDAQQKALEAQANANNAAAQKAQAEQARLTASYGTPPPIRGFTNFSTPPAVTGSTGFFGRV